MTSTEFRYRPFGTFRFVLALLVVFGHLEQTFAPPALDRILRPLAVGNIGVVSFFVLSGFVIAEALTVFYSRRLWAFGLNRALRIYPPYLLALAVSLGVHAWLFHWKLPILDETWRSFRDPLPMNLFAVADARIPAAREDYYLYVRYVWAVVTEVQFYVAIAACLAIGRTLARTAPAAQALIWLTVLVFSALYVVSIAVKVPYALKLLEFSPYFLTGVCLYVLVRSEETGRRVRGVYWMTAIPTTLSLVCLARYSRFNWPSVAAYGVSIVVFGWLATRHAGVRHPMRRWDGFFGDLSYPLYLNQFAIEVLLIATVAGPNPVALWGGTLLSVALAAVLHFMLEPSMKHLRDRVRGQAIRKGAVVPVKEVLA